LALVFSQFSGFEAEISYFLGNIARIVLDDDIVWFSGLVGGSSSNEIARKSKGIRSNIVMQNELRENDEFVGNATCPKALDLAYF